MLTHIAKLCIRRSPHVRTGLQASSGGHAEAERLDGTGARGTLGLLGSMRSRPPELALSTAPPFDPCAVQQMAKAELEFLSALICNGQRLSDHSAIESLRVEDITPYLPPAILIVLSKMEAFYLHRQGVLKVQDVNPVHDK
ncbi:predicted protein [Histoplasma capsulatum var. duboisii H88]|uniref:Predicted protein n=1 Tax=Ajellomyces capsulatus (strain H88) TaxID=544711 RepID=F0UKD6_AJEC8|nr:predicted protein [Histoplasma capsulatum var. duboisii H88]